MRSVAHLNEVKAEATDSERCTIKTEETGTTGTATNEEGENNAANSSSASTIKRKVTIMPRRSKTVPKGLCDQVMTNKDSGAVIR